MLKCSCVYFDYDITQCEQSFIVQFSWFHILENLDFNIPCYLTLNKSKLTNYIKNLCSLWTIFFGVYVLNENKVNDVATAIHINAIIRVSTVYIPLMRIVIKISQKKALGSIFTEFRNSPMRIPSIWNSLFFHLFFHTKMEIREP